MRRLRSLFVPSRPGPTIFRPADAASRSASSGAAGRRALLLAGGVVLLWGVIVGIWWWNQRSIPIPPALIGTWTTADPRYADRAFGISDSSITLHVGGGTQVTHAIRRVRGRTDAGIRIFEIEYDDPDGALTVVLSWDSVEGALRLENPAELVWRRAVGAATPP